MTTTTSAPRWRDLLSRAAVTATVVAATLGATSSPAQAAASSNGYAYVWSSNATTAIGVAYTPSLTYQYNSTDSVNTITRLATGSYAVRFPKLNAFGTAQVTAYGASTHRCKVWQWVSSPNVDPAWSDTVLYVRCYTLAGAAVNTHFTASYTRPGAGPDRAAYLWSDQASSSPGTPFTPSPLYQFNSEGGENTVVRVSTGDYVVRLAGLATPIATPRSLLVTAYGTAADPSTYCSMQSSPMPDPSDGVYYVGCFDSSGARADSRFVLTYVENGNHLLAPLLTHASASAGLGCGPPDATSCSLSWPFDTSAAGAITYDVVGPGQYDLNLPVSLTAGNVIVSPYYLNESSRGRCKVAFWNSGGVRVVCTDLDGGVPERATFHVSFVNYTGPVIIPG